MSCWQYVCYEHVEMMVMAKFEKSYYELGFVWMLELSIEI